MPHRVNMAIACLHISAVLYLLVGGLLCLVFLASDEFESIAMPFAIGTLALCLLLIVGIEVVAWGLRRRKFWAWVAGLCIFGIYVPSLFLPLGALGLWGLLDTGSRREFGIGITPPGFQPVMRPSPD